MSRTVRKAYFLKDMVQNPEDIVMIDGVPHEYYNGKYIRVYRHKAGNQKKIAARHNARLFSDHNHSWSHASGARHEVNRRVRHQSRAMIHNLIASNDGDYESYVEPIGRIPWD